MWVAAAYDDLRRAGPDRARQVRRILDSYVVPWFGPQTATVADITYPMVHEWLLMLVDRRHREPESNEARAVPASCLEEGRGLAPGGGVGRRGERGDRSAALARR